MIVSQAPVDAIGPNLIRLPIGSCPGQKRLTTRSLTITAGEPAVASASVNVRPLTNRMRSAPKKSGDTRWLYARGAFCAFVAGCPSAV